MARKMKKFSAGGAQGRYDRRMTDIDKDFAKDSKGKSGRALEVLEAKRAQRKADAEDDRAKRTGADRTATRAAEKAAEGNLTKTRKYGAAQSVTKDTAGPTGKITDTLGALTAPKSGLATAAKKPVQKPVQKVATSTNNNASTSSSSTNTSASKTDFRKVRGGSNSGSPTKPLPTSKFDRQAFVDLKVAAERGKSVNSQNPKLARMRAIAEAPGASRAAVQDYRRAVESGMYKAKGGTVKKEKTMKYAKGGSTPPQPTPAERAAGAKFRESIKNIKPTPAQGKILEKTGKKLAKGGSASCGMAKGGKAATKFGAAMKKKSADTKGRAMMKFAKGGSIDGCAIKGKTKTSMVKMKNGGSC